MNKPFNRRCLLQAGLALGTSILVPSARACEFVTSSLTILHPWTRASEDGASSAIVCMTFKDVVETDTLIGVRTEVAEGAELGGDVAGTRLNFTVHTGQTTVFSEDGVYLRLVGLRFPMQVGRQYPMTLEFSKAGIVRAQLSVDYQRFS